MGVQKKIYDNSPIILQHMLTSIKGFHLKKRRYNNLYYEYLNYFNSIDDIFIEKKHQIQKLLIHLKYNIKFYEKYLLDTPDKNLDERTLLELPVITKEDLRNNIRSFTITNNKKKFMTKTGGTTGKSLNVYSSKNDSAKRMAYLDYFKQKHGVSPFSRRASFTGKEIIPPNQKKHVYWRHNKAINQLLYSGFHVSEKNIPYYIESLNKFKPETMDGFPSSIYRIAKYINNNNIELTFTPKCIFPTAETLLDIYKETIEKAFNCPVRNQYASSEGAPFITECTHGKLHMNIETGYFNLQPYKKEENLFEIIVTSFLNYTTPIVQYRIGDIVEYYEEQSLCECGDDSPYVKRILGRQSDYLLSRKNGKITSANMSNVYKNVPNSIIAIQFVQEVLDKIDVNIVVDKERFKNKHEEIIITALKYRFGNEIKINMNYLDELPKERSGKTLFLKNLLDQPTK